MISFPPKLSVDSEYNLDFDFIGLLSAGVDLASADASAIITSGPDGEVVDILEGTIDVAGTVAGVRVHQGIPGCIYEITVEGTDDNGDIHTMKGVLAVL